MQCGKSLECRAVASALDAIVMALMVEYFSIPPPFGLGSVSGRDYSMDEIVLHAVVPFTGLYGYKYAGFPGLRALVFFEVMAIDTLMFSSAPGPFGDRGGTPRWGLMAGSAACCTQYIRCCPLVPVQLQSTELLATAVGKWWRHQSL